MYTDRSKAVDFHTTIFSKVLGQTREIIKKSPLPNLPLPKGTQTLEYKAYAGGINPGHITLNGMVLFPQGQEIYRITIINKVITKKLFYTIPEGFEYKSICSAGIWIWKKIMGYNITYDCRLIDVDGVEIASYVTKNYDDHLEYINNMVVVWNGWSVFTKDITFVTENGRDTIMTVAVFGTKMAVCFLRKIIVYDFKNYNKIFEAPLTFNWSYMIDVNIADGRIHLLHHGDKYTVYDVENQILFDGVVEGYTKIFGFEGTPRPSSITINPETGKTYIFALRGEDYRDAED
jgi:hypothetical protein